MHITLVIVSIIFLVFRLIYFELAVGRTKAEAFLNAVSRIQSIKYFFPLKYSDSDTPRIRNLKSIANMFLYFFYLTFLTLMILGLVEFIFKELDKR